MPIGDPTAVATRFWDQQSTAPSHVNWMADPRVRAYINERISGMPLAWPMDWFAHRTGGRRFARALSIGCGTGAIERDLIGRGLCESIDAFDGSVVSIETATRLASEAGMGDRIHYSVGDFNDPRLGREAYDLVVFHQSLHHVATLERMMRVLLRALRPDGLLYIDEYVGPSRFDWNDRLIAAQRAWFDRHVPAAARVRDPLPLPIQEDDPSEAVRSSEILTQLKRGFRIIERRDYGGTLLSVVFPAVHWSAAPPSLVDDLIAGERDLLAAGHPSYYTVILAAPKRGPARAWGLFRLWLLPKLRRIPYEIRTRLADEPETVKF